MGIGAWELIIILFVILLLFGGKKLPELAKSLGAGLKEFKKASRDITEPTLEEQQKISENTIESKKSSDDS